PAVARRRGGTDPVPADRTHGRGRHRVRRRPRTALRGAQNEGEHMSVGTRPHRNMRAGRKAPRWNSGPVLRLGSTLSLRVRPRALTVGALSITVLAGLAVTTLVLGDMGIPLNRLWNVWAGGGKAPEAFLLERLRGPRPAGAVGPV